MLVMAWRALRGRPGRVVLVVLCLCLGVMARVAVGSAIHDAADAVQRQARTMVGADLMFSADRPLAAEERDDLARLLPSSGVRSADLRSTVTMASRSDGAGARLVQLRAVPTSWPLRGNLLIEDGDGQQREGRAALSSLFTGPQVMVQRDLLLQLDLAIGDDLRLGDASFRIAGVIVDEPGTGQVMMSIGPTVLMADERLDETGLTGFASRLQYQHQVALPLDQDPQLVAAAIRSAWDLPADRERGFFQQVRPGDTVDVVTAAESLAAVERFLQRFGDFLRLLALLALLVGAVGVAHLVRGFVCSTLEDHALLSVLGARPARVVGIMVIQIAALGLAGGIIGAVLGALLYAVAALIMASSVAIEVSGLPHLPSMLWGILLGLIAGLVAGLPPVLALRRIKPLVILRGEANRLPGDRLLGYGLVAAGIAVAVVVAAVETRSWNLGPALVLGAVLVAVVLGLCAQVVLPLLRRLPVTAPGLRHGLANLCRPGFRPTAAVVALGVAACVLGVLATYRSSLSGALDASIAERAPSLYAIEIPDHEIERLRDIALAEGAASVESAPMVTARLRRINDEELGREARGEGREAERRHWARTREQRLSWRSDLGPDEVIRAGTWMTPDSEGEVSLASNFAEAAGIVLGDSLTVDIQGVRRMVRVTSIREVDWLGFRLNFFMLLSPRSLDGAPRQWLATMAVPANDAATRMRLQAVLAREFPMVTTIDVAQQVDKARGVFSRMSVAVVALSLIAMLAGLAVVVGICAASAHERRQDAALLRVCGARDGDIIAAVVSEFGGIAITAAVLGIGLSLLASWAILSLFLDLPLTLPWWELAGLALAMAAAVILTGILATRRVRIEPPLAVLRSADS